MEQKLRRTIHFDHYVLLAYCVFYLKIGLLPHFSKKDSGISLRSYSWQMAEYFGTQVYLAPIYQFCLRSIYAETCRAKSQLFLSLLLTKFANTDLLPLQVKRYLLAEEGLKERTERKLLLHPYPTSLDNQACWRTSSDHGTGPLYNGLSLIHSGKRTWCFPEQSLS